MKAREMSAVLIVIKKRETPFGSGVEFSLLTQLTASCKKPFTIPGECLSNFLINFNGIRTSLGKSTTQTPGDFRGPLSCIQFNKGYSTILPPPPRTLLPKRKLSTQFCGRLEI